jgi:glycosyltransferase involved in cell wall biosynthesis
MEYSRFAIMETTSWAEVLKDHSQTQLPFKVCIHVLREARNDVRAMRAATALVKAGFSVDIVDIKTEHSQPNAEYTCRICLKHITIPSWYTSRRFEPWFFVISVQAFFLSVFRLLQTRADIYHASELTALPAACIAALLSRKPLIFEAYELHLPLPETNISFWHPLGGLLMRLLAVILPRCAGVITVSPPIVEEIHKRFRVPEVTLIRNVPVYQVVQKNNRLQQFLGLNPHVRIAVYQGTLHASRGLDLLVQAAPYLAPDIVIVMMGAGPTEIVSHLEALIASERVTDRIKIIPPVPYTELLAWTASADIGLYVLPRDYSLSIRWSLGNKLFEYLMAGLPVLTSELDAAVEVIKNYDVGQIVSSLAPPDLAAAINTMLTDTTAHARMRANALEAAQHEFCWEKESQKLIHLYEEIVSK